MLPGRREPDGAPICTDCAGFTTSFRCSRCPDEGKLHAGRLCTRCTLTDQLTTLLDDGTGHIRPELLPLHERLAAMDNPRSGLRWLEDGPTHPPAAAALLRGLGRGEIELTHAAFHQLQPWRAAAHLRELLMACGLLPPIDKHLCSLERWLIEHLGAISDPEHEQIVRRFATWHVLPKLRARAGRRPLTTGSRQAAGAQIRAATTFLQWLADHQLRPADCRQADLDAWTAHQPQHARTAVRAFVIWSASATIMRRLRAPTPRSAQGAPITRARRVELLRKVLTDDDAPLRSRVAAGLVLLYAQPVSRIVRLTLDDIVTDDQHDEQVLLRLGTPPSPVPQPFAALLLAYAANRANMRTATNPSSPWLFPGRRAGQPLSAAHLAALVRNLGVPTVAGRGAAIRQHLTDMPAPIVADALGYHYVTTARLTRQAGTTWSRYAPGDHSQPAPS